MTTQDHDTDPSTPGAKRLSDPLAPAAIVVEDADAISDEASLVLEDAAALAAEVPSSLDRAVTAEAHVPSLAPRTAQRAKLARPTTDPGIAPPPKPLPVPPHPMGIVVPSAAPKAPDAIDALLDGISREPSERRTIAQTDGQRVARYHAKHAVRAAHASVDDEPKVVIARQVLAQTVRVAKAQRSSPDADPKAWAETTAVQSQPVAGRVFVAVVAGLLVVTAIFFALRRISGERAAEATGAPLTASAAAALPMPAATENVALLPAPRDTAAAVAISPPSADPQASAAPIAAASIPSRKTAPVWKPIKPKTKLPASAAKSTAADLGEFKAAF